MKLATWGNPSPSVTPLDTTDESYQLGQGVRKKKKEEEEEGGGQEEEEGRGRRRRKQKEEEERSRTRESPDVNDRVMVSPTPPRAVVTDARMDMFLLFLREQTSALKPTVLAPEHKLVPE